MLFSQHSLHFAERNREYLFSPGTFALLRTQVARLKDELSVAKRLQWIRRGIYGTEIKKGAQILMQGITARTTRTNYNLNVELKQDGTATVVPSSTNAPPEQ